MGCATVFRIVRRSRWILGLTLACTAACGDDDFAPYQTVGLSCGSALDCGPGVDCERGGDFPDGTCTFECRNHLDCAPGTACTDVHGGLCLVACANESYCRSGYKCKSKHDRDGNGDSLVCIK